MNNSAIYSKTGKGVQEASGKTSHLSRADRAVLSAIDGKTTVGELHKKFEKTPENKFQQLVEQLEKEGFLRQLAGGQASSAAPAGAKPQAGAAASDVDELDFTQVISKSRSAPPAALPPKPQVDLAAQARGEAERRAKEEAFSFKARQEAEAKAKAEASVRAAAEARARAEAEAKAKGVAEARIKAEAEARARALAGAKAKLEAEALAKAEAEAKAKLDAEAKAKAEAEARAKLEAEAKARAEAEAKATAEAEAKARVEAQVRARAAAEARAKIEAETRAKIEVEARARIEAETRAKVEAELKDKLDAERRARAQAEQRAAEERRAREEAEQKAREEAERKAHEEAERRAREEAERKARDEAERKAREEAERKAREEAERKAREEAERKAREEAERKAREEAERKAREEAERKAREEAERKAREEAERKAREEAERKAREEAERKAREEAERKARDEAERKVREEAERKARDEAERKARDEAERKAREEAERRAREEAERGAREEAEQKSRQEAERKGREETERKVREEAERKAREADERARAEAAVSGAASVAKPSSDDLLGDIDSFSQREEEEQKAQEEANRRAAEDSQRRAREQVERVAREAEETGRRLAGERRAKEEAEQRAKEEAERAAREEQERAQREQREAEERKRRAREALAAKATPTPADDDIVVSDDELDMDDVVSDQKALGKAQPKAPREPSPVAAAREEFVAAAEVPPAGRARSGRTWGKPLALGLFAMLVVAMGVLHVMPLSPAEYEKLASDAVGQPVKIGSARLSAITGIQLKFERVTIGEDVRIGLVRTHPEIGSLFSAKKAFSRIDLEEVAAPQRVLAALFGSLDSEDLKVARIGLKAAKLDGGILLPPLDADFVLGDDGALKSGVIRGPDSLVVRLAASGKEVNLEGAARSFAPPFAPQLNLSDFGMKGVVTRQAVTLSEWSGNTLEGNLSGTARIRWGSGWSVDGEVRTRGINVAVFAPALVSEGKVEGRANYAMSGAEPAKLTNALRMEGSFTVAKGVLGSFDLSRAIQTAGNQPQGRTLFSEMTGQGIYDKGAITLRNVNVNAGALNAAASVDIAPSGTLSGRVVSEIKTAAQTQRATLNLTGTIKEPLVRK